MGRTWLGRESGRTLGSRPTTDETQQHTDRNHAGGSALGTVGSVGFQGSLPGVPGLGGTWGAKEGSQVRGGQRREAREGEAPGQVALGQREDRLDTASCREVTKHADVSELQMSFSLTGGHPVSLVQRNYF